MEEHIVKILGIKDVTHDVKRFTLEKPSGYKFIPGQATEVSINHPKLKDEKRPFTFTGLNEWSVLEFTIKIYPQHNGVTNKLADLKQGDELIIHDVWGAINYQGPGVFIAGGAGITPFIAIIRDLYQKNKIKGNTLLFSNKTSKDIILKEELSEMLGENFHNVLTREKNQPKCRIDEAYIKNIIKNYNQKFYICGPDKFVKELQNIFTNLGVNIESIIFEK